MQEVLLHYLWRYQKFSSPSLVTTEGKEISIIRPGNPNAGGGPDFLEAQIFFDALLWNGPVEVHRQGLMHLFKNYCQKHQCLTCNVEFHLMKS
jgi:hypothetical protein